MIIAKALNFKMATSSFVNVSEEVMSAIEENSTAKSPKDAKRLTEKYDMNYLQTELNKPAKSVCLC